MVTNVIKMQYQLIDKRLMSHSLFSLFALSLSPEFLNFVQKLFETALDYKLRGFFEEGETWLKTPKQIFLWEG